jgi:hypothetical protein
MLPVITRLYCIEEYPDVSQNATLGKCSQTQSTQPLTQPLTASLRRMPRPQAFRFLHVHPEGIGYILSLIFWIMRLRSSPCCHAEFDGHELVSLSLLVLIEWLPVF